MKLSFTATEVLKGGPPEEERGKEKESDDEGGQKEEKSFRRHVRMEEVASNDLHVLNSGKMKSFRLMVT